MAYQQQTPDFVIEKAEKEIAQAEKRVEQAKKRIPDQYHDFLTLLDQNVKLFGTNMAGKDDQARDLRIWGNDNGTYVTISLPYVTVDGRVQMARDEHRKEGKKLNFLPTEISDNGKFLSVTVESELLGTATGSVMINVGGTGVDRTNPLENAETSAVGRALSFLGYGLVGTGIASADEVESAKKAEASSHQSTETSTPSENGHNVVDLQKSKEKRETQTKNGYSELKPNVQFVDMRALSTKSGNPCYEMIFKAGDREAKCYAVGKMVEHIEQIADSLKENVRCYIETEKKDDKLILHELKVVHGA